MNLAEWLYRAGRSHAGRPAIAFGADLVFDYGTLAARAARIATALKDRFGLVPGDRVAITAKNCVEYVEILYGIWHGGCVAVPANAKLHGAELAWIIENAGARICFASAGVDDEIAAEQSLSCSDVPALNSFGS